MAIIKRYSPLQNLGKVKVFINDSDSDSPYFNITELEKTLTGGKNAFLFEGSPYFKKGSKVRFEATDVNGNPLYIEPGKQGDKTFREGNSIVMAIHVYDDTPIGMGQLTIVAELETYIDDRGRERKIPNEFKGVHNIRWTQKFKINPKIPNKTQVRFFKRPAFSVTEIEKPLLVKTDMTLTKSGSVVGIPEIPDSGRDFSTWTAPSQYRIKLQEGNKFTQSMEENTTLQIPSLGYSSSVLEVINADEMIVRKPYLVNNIVQSFEPVSYSLQFESVEDAVITGSNVTASYAEIRLENLKTFTGDVARIKIFRKSRNDLGDFQVVQENKLDATELLRDFSVPNRTVINYGKLRRENIVSEAGDVYYTTSSGVQIHNKHLINSLLVSGSHSVESSGSIGEFQIVSGSEYSLSYLARYSGSGASVDTDSLRFLITSSINNVGSPTVTSQSIDVVSGSYDRDSNGLGNVIVGRKNFFAECTGKCQIRVESNTNESEGKFLFSRLSLKNAEESSYSPDEYTAIVDIPRKNPTEQFDFRVEFYDINNNFIPIKVEQSVPFTKGNQAVGLEASINVKNSGIADAGDILSVQGGVVQIASTNIQSSTIAGLGDPTNFSAELQTATASLESKTTNLQIATASLGADITSSLAAGAVSASNAAQSASLAENKADTALVGNQNAVLSGSAAATLVGEDSVLSGSLSASAAQSNAESFATTAANNATLSGSLSASVAITGNENAVLSGSAFATIAGDNSVLSGSAFSADAALSASESGSVDPSTGKLTKTPTPAGSGLFLGAENMGFYDTDQWKTYMSSSGEFFLTGSDANNYLRWSGSTLEIGGSIVLTNGSPSTNLGPLNAFTESQDSINSNLNAATSSYLSEPATFGGGGFDLADVTLSGGGLYLGANNLGYYDGGAWKTYMDNNGNFFLGGTSGNLTWNGTNLLINGIITASAGYIGTPADGFNINSSYIGNGKATLGDSNTGVYVGTDGIALGASNVFSVTDAGGLTATNASISGSITAQGGSVGGWSIDGNTLSSTSMSLDSTAERISIGDKLSIKTGTFASRTTTDISFSIPAFTFSNYTFSTTTNYGQGILDAQTGGAGTFTVTDPGTYTFTFDNSSQYDKTNYLTNNSYNGMFMTNLQMEFRTAGSGGGTLLGTIPLANAYGSLQANSDLDTNMGTKTVTFDNTGTVHMRVILSYMNYAIAGNFTTTNLSETAYSRTMSKQANFTEVTDRGIQAVGSSTRWVSMDINGSYAFESQGGMNIDADGNYIYLQGQLHPYTGNTHDIGTSGNRWRTLYVQNSVNVSDRRLKNNITGSDLGLDFVNSLNPIKFKYNNSETPRYHYGFVAQEITSSLSTFGHTSDTAGFIYSSSLDSDVITKRGWEEEGGENLPDYEVYQNMISSSNAEELMINYNELLSPMIKAIQELSAKVVQLENQISGSE